MARALLFLVPTPREAYAQGLVGMMIWLLAAAVLEPGWSPALLAFGPLVFYPLLLEMIGESMLRRWSLVAFLPVLASYGLEQGAVAGALTLTWLAFALVLAVQRARRLVAARTMSNLVHFVVAGFLIVGAAWLTLARLGQRPLDYEHAIVHATAVHFHFTGFVLPILALQWTIAAPRGGRYFLLAMLLLGVPLVAAGITLSAFGIVWPELFAVIFFAATCAIFAWTQIRFAITNSNWLLLISGMSLIVAMILALAYGTRLFLTLDWLDIPLMLRTHGPIQVFGFALPGVVAWTAKKQDNVNR